MKSITRFTNNLHGNKCQNCQKIISTEDNFCSECGQVNDTRRISIKQYFSVYFEDFFDFDNRFIRTVIPLLFKPGRVTKEYVEGRRMYYVNPFQLYLHITIVFFLIVGLFQTIDSFKPGDQNSSLILADIDPEKRSEVIDSLTTEALAEINKPNMGFDSATVASINQGIDQASSMTKPKDSNRTYEAEKKEIVKLVDSIFLDSSKTEIFIDERYSTKDKDSVAGEIMKQIDQRSSELMTLKEGTVITGSNWDEIGREWEKSEQKEAINSAAGERIDEILASRGSSYTIPDRLVNPDKLDLPNNALGSVLKKVKMFMDYDKKHEDAKVIEALDDMGFELSYWNVFYYNKARDINEALTSSEYWKELLDRVLSRVSVALFFLLPIFTLIVSLLYIRRKYNYTENLVFVFHVQTVFFLLLLIFMLIGRIMHRDWFTWIFLTVFLLYLYKAMRNFYEQGRFKTIIKFILLNTSFFILAAIGGVIVSFLAFLI